MVKLVRFLFVCAVMLAIAGTGFAGITIWYFGRDLPDYQQLVHYEPAIMTRVHAGDGRLLAEGTLADLRARNGPGDLEDIFVRIVDGRG